MSVRRISATLLDAFEDYLHGEERSDGTVEKYMRDMKRFAGWLAGREVTKEAAALWKGHLAGSGHKPATVNSMLSALNQFFLFSGWAECRVKYLRIQRQLFRSEQRELTREEYGRLLAAAQERGRERLALLLQTICASESGVSVPMATAECGCGWSGKTYTAIPKRC